MRVFTKFCYERNKTLLGVTGPLYKCVGVVAESVGVFSLESDRRSFCDISSSHGGEYEGDSFLVYSAV
jgi:hypothetical protein